MTIKSTVATPTPHYDYTLRHNHQVEDTKYQRVKDHVRTSQVKWEDYYHEKHKRIDDANRIEKALTRKKELEQLHQYEVLASHKSYADYRYMFYIGTQFDTYI